MNDFLVSAALIMAILFSLVWVIVGITLLGRWEKEKEESTDKELTSDELADPLRPDSWDGDPADWWKYNKNKS